MFGLVHIFLHFVKAGRFNKGQRVFLCINGTSLKRCEHFGECHRGRAGTKGFPYVHKQRNVRDAQFQTIEVGRCFDRAV